MSTWRDADDPRCPECDGPLAATASYCMHCEADLPLPSDADVSPTDDYDPSASPSTADVSTPRAPLWMRAPVAVGTSLFVSFFATVVVVMAVEALNGTPAFFIFASLWVGTAIHFGRKPVPSDVLGDAFYALAGLLLVAPVLGYGLLVVETAVVGGTRTVPGLLGDMFVVELFVLFPAAFFAVLGLVGNWWAARRLAGAKTDE